MGATAALFVSTDGLVTSALARLVLTVVVVVRVLVPVLVLGLCLVMVTTTVVVVKTVVSSSEADVDEVVSPTSDEGNLVSWSADEMMLSKMMLQVFLSEVVGRFDHDQTSPS